MGDIENNSENTEVHLPYLLVFLLFDGFQQAQCKKSFLG
jgi:hypothetical protein